MLLDLLITLLILLVIFVVVRYAITVLIPMDPGLQNVILTVLGLLAIIWILLILLGAAPGLGLWHGRRGVLP